MSAGAEAESHALVSLYADGQQRIFSTDAATVGDVLRRADVKLGAGDIVEPVASSPVPTGSFTINVYRAHPALVVDGQTSYHLSSAYQSPRLLALAAGLVIFPEDKLSTQIITDIVGSDAIGEKITITRAKPITIDVDGHSKVVRTQAATVSTALSTAGIALGTQDTTSVPTTAPVLPGMTVGITRVTEAVVTLTQDLPMPVKTITDPTVLAGVTTVQAPGADGQKNTTYRIHYHDGTETSREAIQVVSQTAPIPKVMVVGTKIFFAGSVEYWRPQVDSAAATYNLDPNMLLRIMNCESHGNATDVSNFVVNGEHPTGLFQFLPSTWVSSGGTPDNIFDGAAQIQIAAKKMAREGTKAWACK